MTFWETFSLLTLIYIIPCYLFYLYFAIILFTKDIPEFQTSFFNLIKLLSIIDLTLLPLFYIGYRLGHVQLLSPIFEIYQKPSIFITIYIYLFCVLQHSQLILHLIMAFNRFSATVMIKCYKTFWNIKKFWIIVLIIFAFPGFYMSWILVYGGYYRYGIEHQGFMLDNIKTGSNVLRKSTMLLIVGTVTCGLTLILDTFTIAFLYNRRKKLKLLNKKKYYSDIRLFGVCFILFLVTAGYVFTELMLSLYAYTDLEFTYRIVFPFQSSALDLATFISPISVLALNPKIRRHFIKPPKIHRSLSLPSHATNELFRPHIIFK